MKLFYRKYGQGPVLVILHGLFGSSDNWTTIAKNLSDDFTVILPDQRNHGQSPHSGIHDYESMSEDLHELVTSLSISKFFLAGHSMGGKTAIAFALKWPEMLEGLLVADISPFRSDDRTGSEHSYHEKILNAMRSLDLSQINSREEADSELKKAGLSLKIRGFVLKNLRRTDNNRFEWKLNVNALLKNLNNIMRPMKRDSVLSNIITGFPVLFLKGSESDYLPPNDYPDILSAFPAAEFIEISNAGHWLHADNPDEVIKSIRKLLP
ncbi:MAG TPA: alpha/beta fold hydrolase [Bacteroidales bacterium]|nr:alpha/beta fold hydrolase [Bacteroidales bacterium]